MKAFGLELRKVGSVAGLYSEIDTVLKKHGVQDCSVGKKVATMAVAHALHKMMDAKKWFDVCAIDSCISICQIVIPRERYNIYRSAHCLYWDEMLPDYREALIAMVLDDFRSILNPAA